MVRSIPGRTLAIIVSLGLSSLLGLSAPSHAATMTVPHGLYGPALPALRAHVPARVVALYRGQYVLTSSTSSARLTSGTLHIGTDPSGNLIGVMALYGYDAQGYQSSEVFRLWNFAVVAPTTMRSDVLLLNASYRVGQIVVGRSARGDLRGQITLDAQTSTFSWHRVAAQ